MSQGSRQILADAERVLLEPERTFGSNKGNFGSILQSRLTDPQGQKPDSMFQKVCSLHLPAMVCYKWIQMEFEIVWACFRLGKLVWGPGGLLEVINAICTWTAQRTKHGTTTAGQRRTAELIVALAAFTATVLCFTREKWHEVTEWLWVTCSSWCLKW